MISERLKYALRIASPRDSQALPGGFRLFLYKRNHMSEYWAQDCVFRYVRDQWQVHLRKPMVRSRMSNTMISPALRSLVPATRNRLGRSRRYSSAVVTPSTFGFRRQRKVRPPHHFVRAETLTRWKWQALLMPQYACRAPTR